MNDEDWYQSARRLGEFRTQQARWPRAGAQDAQEDALGRFLRSVRARARAGRLTSEEESILNRRIPGWQPRTIRPWAVQADRLAGFVRRTGRLPQQTAVGHPERQLARWLAAQRTRARRGTMSDVERATLDQAVPQWLPDARPVEARWYDKASRVLTFFGEHERWPRLSGNLPGERSLAQWLHAQRSAARRGDLPEGRWLWLDVRNPSWIGDTQEPAAWARYAMSLAEYVAERGTLPVATGQDTMPVGGDLDAVVGERLARWLDRQRKAAAEGRLRSEWQAWLNTKIPDWSALTGAAPTSPARGA